MRAGEQGEVFFDHDEFGWSTCPHFGSKPTEKPDDQEPGNQEPGDQHRGWRMYGMHQPVEDSIL